MSAILIASPHAFLRIGLAQQLRRAQPGCNVLDAANAAARVDDSAALVATVRRLIHDRSERERLVHAARSCITRFTGALDRTLDALEPHIAPISRQ